MRGQDLLTALADELKGLAPELVSAYDAGSPGDDAYLTSVSRLSEAAGYMGLMGVQRIGSCVTDNLQHLDSEDQDARVLVRPFFTEWAQLLEAHLRNASEPGPVAALIAHFGGGWVPLPLDEPSLNDLRAELTAASGIGAALDENEQAAPEALEASDLALDISSDVDAALIDAFLNDSPPQAAEVTRSLQGWIADPTQSELLRNAKRAAHTLKGSANILGIRGVAKVAHRLEDILEICENEGSRPPRCARRRSCPPPTASSRWWPRSRAKTRRRKTRWASSSCSMPRATTPRRTPYVSASSRCRSKRLRARRPRIPSRAFARASERRPLECPPELLDNLVRMSGELTDQDRRA
jgi:chemosensory pili system protein ChpA (sensor histidine kinase/response regulator)